MELSEGLPAVLPLVLYNGKRPWNVAVDLASLFRAVPPGLARYQPQLTYLLIDENRLLPEELDLPDSRVATLFRLETCSPADIPELTTALSALLPKGQDLDLRRHFTAWLISLVSRLRPEVKIPEIHRLEETAMLEETLLEWWNGAHETGLKKGRTEGHQEGWQEGRTEGRQEGWQEGRQEGLAGMRRLLLQLLEQRFGSLPAPLRRRVQAIQSVRRLQELAGRVLTAGSLREMGLE